MNGVMMTTKGQQTPTTPEWWLFVGVLWRQLILYSSYVSFHVYDSRQIVGTDTMRSHKHTHTHTQIGMNLQRSQASTSVTSNTHLWHFAFQHCKYLTVCRYFHGSWANFDYINIMNGLICTVTINNWDRTNSKC